jgi:DNA-binding MarR family transcriptional regulator
MSSASSRRSGRRAALAALRESGRAYSDATVLWHTTIAERVGIHPTDYKTLSLLQRRGPLSAGAIGETTGLATASVTALIDRLEARRFARRRRDPSDGRRVIVEATAEGIATFAPFFRSPYLSQEQLFAPYTVDQLEVIHDFLGRSAERLRQATRRLTKESHG